MAMPWCLNQGALVQWGHQMTGMPPFRGSADGPELSSNRRILTAYWRGVLITFD